MNTTTPLTDRADQHDAAQISTAALQQVAPPFAEAANDAEFYRNPLWEVVGAMAVLFGLLAILTASG